MNRKLYANLALSVCLGACSTAGKLTYGAADIKPELISIEKQEAEQAGTQKAQYLYEVVGDSETKCAQFQLSLTGSDTQFNTTADILSTIASAGGTLFPAVATVHAISAVGSVINGTKTAVDTDMWAKQTISNLQAAIGNIYTTNMNKFLSDLGALNESNIIVGQQIDRVLSIHATCNLATAQTSMSAVVSGPPSAGGSTPPPPPSLPGQGAALLKPQVLNPHAGAMLLGPLPAARAPATALVNGYAPWR